MITLFWGAVLDGSWVVCVFPGVMTTGASSGKQAYDAYGTSFELLYPLWEHFDPIGDIIVFQFHISSS